MSSTKLLTKNKIKAYLKGFSMKDAGLEMSQAQGSCTLEPGCGRMCPGCWRAEQRGGRTRGVLSPLPTPRRRLSPEALGRVSRSLRLSEGPSEVSLLPRHPCPELASSGSSSPAPAQSRAGGHVSQVRGQVVGLLAILGGLAGQLCGRRNSTPKMGSHGHPILRAPKQTPAQSPVSVAPALSVATQR